MGRRRRRNTQRNNEDAVPRPTVAASQPPKRNYARWRAISLSLVYVVFAIHIAHWKITGRSLAPLELNEVMYTLELGIITAGFIFMCLLVLGTMIFGRFFCSWACHIMVLQDACAWILRRLGIRSKPIRSRLLLLVPPLTAFYMFIWPQIVRTWESRALPTFHLATDDQGWASLVTNNFWRNLPGPWVIVVTFLVCGFLIVYLMGSRTFCTYVCPYGAVFSLADRLAPGRIRVNDQCRQCGTCTSVCTSAVRVHEEVKQHGMIVNPACLKDMDCVSACPQNAIHYEFGRPSLLRSHNNGRRFGLPYDFTIKEELLIAGVFVAVLLSFRGLYSQVPFLLSLALGAIIGYILVTVFRLAGRPNVKLATLKLKDRGLITGWGKASVAMAMGLLFLVVHSGVVRYHEYTGLRQTNAISTIQDDQARTALASSAFSHLQRSRRWGLLRNPRVERGLVSVSMQLENFNDVHLWATRFLRDHPGDLHVRFNLAKALISLNRTSEAEAQHRLIAHARTEADHTKSVRARSYHALGDLSMQRGDLRSAEDSLQRSLQLDAKHAPALASMGTLLAELGRFDEAIANLQQAVDLDPTLGQAQYNLGTLMGTQRRFDEAIACYQLALAQLPEDADVLNNLGFALLQTDQFTPARRHLERAIGIQPHHAGAHFNLAVLLARINEEHLAQQHLTRAVELDPRYARMLQDR